MKPNDAIVIDHPLLEKLRRIDEKAAKRFPAEFDKGLGQLGLKLEPKPKRWDYFCTPRNVVTFANTGGDGVHFSLLALDGKVTESSPVVVTIPELGENYIVGEDLHDFLCLGTYRGYFAIQQISSDRFFEPYSSESWQPQTDSDFAVGFGVDERQRELLKYLKSEFNLKPWKDLKKKFERLQSTYGPLLSKPYSPASG